MLHITSRSEAEILQERSAKDEKENMIIEESDNSLKLSEYNNSNLMNSESLNLVEPNNINNNNIQFKNNNYKFFQPGVIAEIEGDDKSFMNLRFSKISSQSFFDDSDMGSISNILELKEKQEIFEFVKDKMDKGLIPFFIKFEQFAPIPIFSQKDIRFIDVLQRIQEEIKFEVNSVEFILKGKTIEISNYYNKTIEELGIEPLNIIHAKFKK